MSWRTEKTKLGQDLVWDGVETGIAPSPTKGTAMIQNANIATESGEIMASYGRTEQDQTVLTGQTLTAVDATLFSGPATLQAGQWITISATTITTQTVTYLAIAGGAGGGGGQSSTTGNGGGGGGGAGGMLTGTTVSLGVRGTYAVTVGAGGSAGVAGTAGGGVAGNGGNGNNSSIAALAVSTGGGGGAAGKAASPGITGLNGGSGGGGAGAANGGTATIGQGNNGGVGVFTGGSGAGAGGGGAGAVGQNGNGSINGGNGGNGTASSISGASVTYAGGGGGASPGGLGTGGTGGGGAAGGGGVAGTANLGAGGGGGTQNNLGGAGGSGIVIISYPTGSMTATGGTITTSGGNTIHTFTSTGTFTVTVPMFMTGTYYVSYKNNSNQVKLSAVYDPEDLYPVTHGTSGTATFSVATTMSAPIAKATEKYSSGSSAEYRYYILDSEGYVWVYDTKYYADTLAADGVGIKWFLPDNTDNGASGTNYGFSGIAILNGWVHVGGTIYIWVKQTVNLGTTFTQMVGQAMNSARNTEVTHFMYTGHQGKMYYTDGHFIGEVFPTTSIETSVANIQTYAKYTAVTTTGTMNPIISGGTANANGTSTRIPAVFFTDALGTQPTNLTASTVYYIQNALASANFSVYATSSDGAAINIAAGAAGNQYFNTYYPLGTDASATGSNPLMTLSLQRVNLPLFEVAQCMVEIGNTIIIGGITNTLYPWNQIDALPSDLIALPESNVSSMINVNNVAYVFAGFKGNIYITNGSVASLVAKVPDYAAGVPGTPLTYIEPYFTWGDSMYLRGRVYFSILDQNATKAGNCGGVWSFYPTQNFYVGQDTGLALRLENQNSYGSYNGLATVLIPDEEQQDTVSPQYWAGWRNGYTVAASTLFGVDYTNTVPVTLYVFETDLLPTGTFLNQETFDHVEYKLTTPLASGDSVQLYYRLNATDAWTSCGTVVEETSNKLSGYFPVNFQKTQWLQLRGQVTLNGTITSSFGRLKQLRVR